MAGVQGLKVCALHNIINLYFSFTQLKLLFLYKTKKEIYLEQKRRTDRQAHRNSENPCRRTTTDQQNLSQRMTAPR
uniref:Uncharacterized protein n=1 Tax=Anguilla anguilla TaxID=7936 RepID=A0A0E9XKD4_ANGAN